MKNNGSVYILIPVFNRKTITLKCLETLQENGDLSYYHTVVIDDGSTDGTAEVIRSLFPTVTILTGDGNLWWTGAIAMGMKYAYQQGADYFIWLNDDTLPAPDTLKHLVWACIATPRQIVTAQCYTDNTYTQPTYGGRLVRRGKLQFLETCPDQTITCDVCSGNLVCLPRLLVDTIGYPPGRQAPQTWGDVVYTWWARESGFQIQVLGSAIAVCPNNPLEEGWSSSHISMQQRWQMLKTPKSSIYPPAYWFYCRQLYGWWGVLFFVQVYVKLLLFTVIRWLIPLSWLTLIKKMTPS